MTKAGFGVGAQKSLFLKLDKLSGGGGRPMAWMMSHPKTTERIAAIEAREKKWKL
jgi:putative metalloprotease